MARHYTTTTLTSPQAFYALSSGSLAFILPFLNVYLTSHGLTAAQIGVLAAVRPFVGAPAAAAVAAVADASGRHRALLGGCFIAAALGRLAIPLAPGDFGAQIGLAIATEAVAAPVQVIADAAVVAAAAAAPTGDGYGRARLWGAVGWGGLSLVAGWLVAARGVEAGELMRDERVEAKGGMTPPLLRAKHGRRCLARAWHVIMTCLGGGGTKVPAAQGIGGGNDGGWPSAALHISSLPPFSSHDPPSFLTSPSFPLTTPPSHTPGFAAYAAAAAFALAPTLLLPVGALASKPANARRPTTSTKPSLASRVKTLLTPRAACFYGLAICLGFAASVTASYLPIYLHDTLGGSKAMLGAAIAVACAAEIPVFYYSTTLVSKLGSRRVLDIAAIAFAVRLLGYTIAGRAAGPAAVVPLEALHGLGFAGAWAAGTERCAALAPPGLKSTAQSLFSAAYMGVGGGAGALVGGALYTSGGPEACFQGSAAALIAAWALLCVAEAALAEEEEDGVGVAAVPRTALASSDEWE